jgi:hypothetical protein
VTTGDERNAGRCPAVPSAAVVPVARVHREHLRCVLAAGHEPTGPNPDHDPDLGHNFGGLGPYTPGQRTPGQAAR